MEKEKITYIKEHIDERPRRMLARKVNISVTALYRILHELGYESGNYAFTPKPNAKRDKQITELYPTHTASEIAQIINCDEATIYKAAKRLHLSHTKDTLERANKKRLSNLSKSREKDVADKRIRSRRKTQRLERFRYISGIPQRTRLKFSKMPKKHYMAKYNIIRKYGYFAYEDNPFVIGFDSNTKRTNEQYYIDKYGFKFEEENKTCQEE